MNIREAFYTFLKGEASITALVGSGDDTRIYPETAPQNITEPYITHTVISDSDGAHLLGADGLAEIVFQVDSWSRIKENCIAIAEALRNLLNGYQGGTWGTVEVESALRLSERDGIEFPPDASEVGWTRITQEFHIWFRET